MFPVGVEPLCFLVDGSWLYAIFQPLWTIWGIFLVAAGRVVSIIWLFIILKFLRSIGVRNKSFLPWPVGVILVSLVVVARIIRHVSVLAHVALSSVAHVAPLLAL